MDEVIDDCDCVVSFLCSLLYSNIVNLFIRFRCCFELYIPTCAYLNVFYILKFNGKQSVSNKVIDFLSIHVCLVTVNYDVQHLLIEELVCSYVMQK